MKWSDIAINKDSWVEQRFDENDRAVKGFWLRSIGFDLNELSDSLFRPACALDADTLELDNPIEQRVKVNDIVGTCHTAYSDIELIRAYIRLQRAWKHIDWYMPTPLKYFRLLKKPAMQQSEITQSVPISCIQNDQGYYTYKNGNHRVIFYMLIYLSEMCRTNNCLTMAKIKEKYWMNAMVYKQKS